MVSSNIIIIEFRNHIEKSNRIFELSELFLTDHDLALTIDISFILEFILIDDIYIIKFINFIFFV